MLELQEDRRWWIVHPGNTPCGCCAKQHCSFASHARGAVSSQHGNSAHMSTCPSREALARRICALEVVCSFWQRESGVDSRRAPELCECVLCGKVAVYSQVVLKTELSGLPFPNAGPSGAYCAPASGAHGATPWHPRTSSGTPAGYRTHFSFIFPSHLVAVILVVTPNDLERTLLTGLSSTSNPKWYWFVIWVFPSRGLWDSVDTDTLKYRFGAPRAYSTRAVKCRKSPISTGERKLMSLIAMKFACAPVNVHAVAQASSKACRRRSPPNTLR